MLEHPFFNKLLGGPVGAAAGGLSGFCWAGSHFFKHCFTKIISTLDIHESHTNLEKPTQAQNTPGI
jgi:hypothetical protein